MNHQILKQNYCYYHYHKHCYFYYLLFYLFIAIFVFNLLISPGCLPKKRPLKLVKLFYACHLPVWS